MTTSNGARSGFLAVIVGFLAGGVGNDASAQQRQSASAAAMLEEVVVTARRREESYQDAPLSVWAITADSMEAQGVNEVRDISDIVPNVTYRDTDLRGKAALFIRGIGAVSSAGTPHGAGLYLDGHYIPSTRDNMLTTLDMERIEVLRGPQGTLFGKNTTGGAIQFITAKPQPEFDAEIDLRVADFGTNDFEGMINVPFSATVAGRFALAKQTSDGYWFNRTLNQDFGAIDTETFSGAIRFTPNDNWLIDVQVRGNYDDSDSVGGQCRVQPNQDMLDRMTAAGFDVSAYSAFENGVGNWGGNNGVNNVGHIDRIYPGATLDFWNNCTRDNQLGNYSTSSELVSTVQLENEFYSATAEWDSDGAIGTFDNLNVQIVGGRLTTFTSTVYDRDYTPLAIDILGESRSSGGTTNDTRSLEVIFNADVNDRLSFVAGTHWFQELREGGLDCYKTFLENQDLITNDFTLDADGDAVGGDVAIPCVPDGSNFGRLADNLLGSGSVINTGMGAISDNESIAIFGQLSYDINEDWTVDFGARWSEEERRYNSLEHALVEGTCVHNPIHFLNNPDLPNAPTEAELIAMGLPTSHPGAPPRTENCQSESLLTFDAIFLNGFYNDLDQNVSEVSPMVSLRRTLAPGDLLESGMVYATISQGFLTGHFNVELNAALVPELAPLLSYDPEFVTNYEVGFKGTLADGRLQLSTAIFYMDYEDKQEAITLDNGDGRFGPDPDLDITANSATAEIYGIELELRAQPWDGGFLSLDVGYLQSEYGEFESFDPDNPDSPLDLSGKFISDFSPEWTVSAMVEHAFLLANGATLTPQLGMYYQTEYDYTRELETGTASVCNQEAYAKFRARLTYEPQASAWHASLFGSNITDERYFAFCDLSRSGTYDYHWAAPESWGLEFVMNFGAGT